MISILEIQLDKIYKILAFFILLMFCPYASTANTGPYRRHIIIAVDESSSFQSAKHYDAKLNIYLRLYELLVGTYEDGSMPSFSNRLCEQLFGSYVHRSNIMLSNEKKNKIPFFNPNTDELSLFMFGMPGTLFDNISDSISFDMMPPSMFFEAVNRNFIHFVATYKNNDYPSSLYVKDKQIHNSDKNQYKKPLHKNGKADKDSPLHAFIKEKMYPMFNGNEINVQTFYNSQSHGITLSQLLYPAILEYIKSGEAFEEYILIVCSDYRSGSYGSSLDDWLRISELCHNQHRYYSAYQHSFNQLNSTFYRLDYFSLDCGSNQPIALAYKIKPMVGKYKPEEISIFLDSDLKVEQSSFLSDKYNIDNVSIKFTHNKNLEIYGLRLKVSKSKDGIQKSIYDAIIPISKLKYDASNCTYIINKSQLLLKGLQNVNSYDNIVFSYEFLSDFKTDGSTGLHYLYKAERTLLPSDIVFSSSIFHKIFIMILFILSLGLIFIIVFLLYYRGKKKICKVCVLGLTADRFTSITAEGGIVDLPCWFRNDPIMDLKLSIPFRIELQAANNRPYILPNMVVSIICDDSLATQGIKFGINNDFGVKKDQWHEIATIKSGILTFNITVYADPNVIKFDQLYKECIRYKIKLTPKGFLYRKSNSQIIEKDDFSIFIHKFIGHAWLGIDPGTSGSSMTIGSSYNVTVTDPKITQVREANNVIIPSKLVLPRNMTQQCIDDMQPYIDYEFGLSAEKNWTAHLVAGDNCYQSIKKLLGYKKRANNLLDVNDTITAYFDNGNLQFEGVELAHLLVKGLVSSLSSFCKQLPPVEKVRLEISNNSQIPRRAVVAIPNNYTLPKILDMVESLDRLHQFSEIRCIYEPEGILFNYLCKTVGNHDYSPPKNIENILVYDMGGATINVTIFRITYSLKNTNEYYDVCTLGRIGYGVGGDNIDVALMKYIFELDTIKAYFKNDDNAILKFEVDNKINILNCIFELKLALIDKLQRQIVDGPIASPILFNQFLTRIVNGKSVSYDFEGSDNQFTDYITKDIITSNPIKNVYACVHDVIDEILKMSAVCQIDSVIYSGRSVLFPNIKESVRDEIMKYKMEYHESFKLDEQEIKTAVSYGACWYGVFNTSVHLDNSKVMNSFGFKFTDNMGSHFKEVIQRNSNYADIDDKELSVKYESDFAGDGNSVNFFQIMGDGKDESIFDNDHKHKRVYIGNIFASNQTEKIFMKLDKNDHLVYKVAFVGGQQEEKSDVAVSRDITDENSMDYYFAALPPQLSAEVLIKRKNLTNHSPRDEHHRQNQLKNDRI